MLWYDPDKILIFKNTHEAIVEREAFERVQKHFAGRKRPDKQGKVDKYAGILYCGNCHKRLYLARVKHWLSKRMPFGVADTVGPPPIAWHTIFMKWC